MLLTKFKKDVEDREALIDELEESMKDLEPSEKLEIFYDFKKEADVAIEAFER